MKYLYKYYLGLGSNLGDREINLSSAVEFMKKADLTEVFKISSIYETDPVGYIEQGKFLNMVVVVLSSLKPEVLLSEMQKIEDLLGRKREIRYGPRTVDIDILLCINTKKNEEVKINSELLTIPHPEMFNRAFVLIPLKEVCVECYDNKAFGKGIGTIDFSELLSKCDDRGQVHLWK